jgi:hypothetical protein
MHLVTTVPSFAKARADSSSFSGFGVDKPRRAAKVTAF